MITNFSIKINLFKPKKNKNIDIEPSAPPVYSDFQLLNDKDLLLGRTTLFKHK